MSKKPSKQPEPPKQQPEKKVQKKNIFIEDDEKNSPELDMHLMTRLNSIMTGKMEQAISTKKIIDQTNQFLE